MRLLVITQVVDLDHTVLGFMHRWLEEFSQHCDHLSVICLQAGRFQLPPNVTLTSLGKERGGSRIRYIIRFYRLLWRLRGSYDAVFVHMNQEYVLLAGCWWRLRGVPVVLWRNHPMGSWLTRVAGRLATTVCYTSPHSYTASFSNARQMPVGIDTDYFYPAETPASPQRWLVLGRLAPIKRLEVVFDGLALVPEATLTIIGDAEPTHAAYVADLHRRAEEQGIASRLEWRRGVTHEATRTAYQEHGLFLNTTPAGSLDKTIYEAMVSGTPVVVTNPALGAALPAWAVSDGTPSGIAASARAWGALTASERATAVTALRAHVVAEHSLTALVDRVFTLLH